MELLDDSDWQICSDAATAAIVPSNRVLLTLHPPSGPAIEEPQALPPPPVPVVEPMECTPTTPSQPSAPLAPSGDSASDAVAVHHPSTPA